MISPFFCNFLRSSFASRRTLRIATFASSANPLTFLANSRRRSSVKAGTFKRITSPSLFGVNPMLASLMARSIEDYVDLSYGLITN